MRSARPTDQRNVTGTVVIPPELDWTVMVSGVGLTPTWVYERSVAGAGTPGAMGSAGPITPKPSTVSTAFGSLVVALTSRRERLVRNVAVTALSVSAGVAFFFTVTVTVDDDSPHDVDQGVQLETTTLKWKTSPSRTLRVPTLSSWNVICDSSRAEPNSSAPPLGTSFFVASRIGLAFASTCVHVKVSGIFVGVVVSRLLPASSVTNAPGATVCAGPASAIGVKTAPLPRFSGKMNSKFGALYWPASLMPPGVTVAVVGSKLSQS